MHGIPCLAVCYEKGINKAKCDGPWEASWNPTENDTALKLAQRAILESYADMKTGRVAPHGSDALTRSKVDAIDLHDPMGLEAAMKEALELMQHGDLLSASARCFGYFNPPAAWPGVIRNQTELPIVLFEDARHGVDSRTLADALEADAHTWLGCVAFEGRTCLRACMTSFLSQEADLDLLLDRLDAVRDYSFKNK